MSKIMEDHPVHDSNFNFFSEVCSTETYKPKVAEMTKGKSRVSGRKALSNISNMSHGVKASTQDHKSVPSSDALRKHIEQLQKEKGRLMKLLADKNKVIELGGIEMQKLRFTLEKAKQQNLQFAQSNSQMLAELNSVKEKQKVLTHELGCKNGLIIAKNLELEGKYKTRTCQAEDSDQNKVAEPEEIEVCPAAEDDDDKHNTNSRTEISESLIHPDKKIQDNDKGKSKRLQKRRQSARFKVDDKPTDDNDDDKMKVDEFIVGTSSSSKKEDKDGDSFKDDNKPQEHHRKTSLSRPVREAAKKVQSYKEVNLVVKMRRE